MGVNKTVPVSKASESAPIFKKKLSELELVIWTFLDPRCFCFFLSWRNLYEVWDTAPSNSQTCCILRMETILGDFFFFNVESIILYISGAYRSLWKKRKPQCRYRPLFWAFLTLVISERLGGHDRQPNPILHQPMCHSGANGAPFTSYGGRVKIIASPQAAGPSVGLLRPMAAIQLA